MLIQKKVVRWKGIPWTLNRAFKPNQTWPIINCFNKNPLELCTSSLQSYRRSLRSYYFTPEKNICIVVISYPEQLAPLFDFTNGSGIIPTSFPAYSRLFQRLLMDARYYPIYYSLASINNVNKAWDTRRRGLYNPLWW